jgi:hypothetical protein
MLWKTGFAAKSKRRSGLGDGDGESEATSVRWLSFYEMDISLPCVGILIYKIGAIHDIKLGSIRLG